ncbi:MAG: DegV family protein [Coriobacteriia bacterium]|nr:DegV family protein [Coriobacteriia bacterium]
MSSDTKTYQIIIDSGADFPAELAKSLGIEMLGFDYVIDGEAYVDDSWEHTDPHEFYEKLRQGAQASTSQYSFGKAIDFFEKKAQAGIDIIYVSMTEALSKSVDQSRHAAEIVMEKYPGTRIEVFDPKLDSSANANLVIEMLKMAKQGMTIDELLAWADEARYFIHGIYTLDNLQRLAEGGRIPVAASQITGKLNIKPLLSYDLGGNLTLEGVARGRKRSLQWLAETFLKTSNADFNYPVFVVNGDVPEDAEYVKTLIQKDKRFNGLPIITGLIGPILGIHVGPGMLAITYWGNDRRENASLSDRIARAIKS